MNALRIIIIFLTIFCFFYPLFAQNYVKPDKPMKYWTKEQINEYWENQVRVNFLKPTGPSDRREGMMEVIKLELFFIIMVQ